ncbi:anhydro-N-acetylmuramic acid kinase [Cryobacterium sp. Y62]|uniref:anhydro-N-acetylmuramic acid kinase n=1 Tax=Cryobacterium sp. Y62 TaxID=2048284 RepID=UPI000CE36141|nr:anhydro-N-acetylmuramic acid kinase [Cryobacterium sp. Y62]
MRVLALQSGTSADGIDVAIVDVQAEANVPEPWLTLRCVLARTVPWPPALRERILAAALNSPVTAEEIGQLDTLLGQEFAAAARSALDSLGVTVDLVVSHGQTVHHWVSDGRARGTLQLGEASWIAEATRAPVLCNLRAADIAAGGDGAPFMGVFDAAWLGECAAASGRPQATLNLGGIANLSVVGPDGSVRAWDTGPANTLVDAVVFRATDGATAFDDGGQLAAAGTIDAGLLREFLGHAFFERPAPKSTGRETFGLAMVDAVTGSTPPLLADLVATLTRLTAETIVASLRAECPVLPERVIVSGGGVHNATLLALLRSLLQADAVTLVASDTVGIEAGVKESLLFALLGFLTWHGVPCTLPGTTPGQARLAGQLVFGPDPVVFAPRLTGIRGLTVVGSAIVPAGSSLAGARVPS